MCKDIKPGSIAQRHDELKDVQGFDSVSLEPSPEKMVRQNGFQRAGGSAASFFYFSNGMILNRVLQFAVANMGGSFLGQSFSTAETGVPSRAIAQRHAIAQRNSTTNERL